jgi:hypothetical protein
LTASGDLLNINPQFVTPSNNDFHLMSTSPAIGAAIDVGLTTDHDGNARPQGLGFDIGAYQFGSAGSSPTPTPTPSPTPSISPTPVPSPTPVSGSYSVLTTQTPAIINANDGVNYELGMKFTSSVPGTITAIRFFKGSSESTGHVGRIWDSSGNILSSVTFNSESASGWQQQALSSSLSIAAGAIYTVSVSTPNGYYVDTQNAFSVAITNGPLSSVVGNNGVYGNPGTFPTNSWMSSNYFRDVVFVASSQSPSPTPTPSPSPSPASSIMINAGGSSYVNSSGLTWSADKYFSGGAVNSTTAAISSTADQKVYQSWRYSSSSFSYTIPVTSGSHSVTLSFSENNSGKCGVGKRVFNVLINGVKVLSNFDIYFQAAGGHCFMAVDRSFNVSANGNNQIVIQFQPVTFNPIVNGIVVH